MRKAFICPTKYVQGENELLNLGYFVASYGKNALLIAHKDDIARVQDKLDATCKKFGVELIESPFTGECSRAEIERLRKIGKENKCKCIIGLGGGKAIDTSKCVAEGVTPLIIVPTIAATDAPTSHSAVVYTEDGAFDDYFYFKRSPSVVMIDTTVIANAPVRFLVSGMGDALSTYFEARATNASYSNVNAGLPCGARNSARPDGMKPGPCPTTKGTMAAMALATLCYKTLLADGMKAKAACECKVVTPALENIIETNILLSGLGFESGGLSAAHAIHNGLSALTGRIHEMTHGEKVAFGTLTQLMLEGADQTRFEKYLKLMLALGLPTTFKAVGIDDPSEANLLKVGELACATGDTMDRMPFKVTPADVADAMRAADAYSRAYQEK